MEKRNLKSKKYKNKTGIDMEKTKINENNKKDKKSKMFLDIIVDFFGQAKIFRPLVKLYYSKREVWLYLFFGVLTTVINIIVYDMLANIIKIDYMVSNVIAWIISVILAYVTNKLYVFESKKATKKETIKEISSFFIARIFSLGIDIVIMYAGISIMNVNDILVKIVSNIIVIIANYFMSKFIIFKK